MKRDEILNKALETVTQRQQVHGKPENTFGAISGMWSVYLSELLGQEVELKDHQSAIMVGLLKVARSIKSPEHVDNYVDLAGYAACAGELAGESALQQIVSSGQEIDAQWPVEQHGLPTNITPEEEFIAWGEIDERLKYVAKDKDGEICAYTHKPIAGGPNNWWFNTDRDMRDRGAWCIELYSEATIPGDWKQSLRKRPK